MIAVGTIKVKLTRESKMIRALLFQELKLEQSVMVSEFMEQERSGSQQRLRQVFQSYEVAVLKMPLQEQPTKLKLKHQGSLQLTANVQEGKIYWVGHCAFKVDIRVRTSILASIIIIAIDYRIGIEFNTMGNENNQVSKEEAQLMIAKEINNTTVDLGSLTNFGDYGIDILVEQPTVHISKLILCRNQITGRGMKSLSRGRWTSLKVLNLWNNQIGSKGCKFLAKSCFRHIQELNLTKNAIETAGMQHLRKGQWRQLRTLNLFNNRIGENGVNAIVKMEVTTLALINLNKNLMMAHQVLAFLIAKPINIKWLQASANKMSNIEAQAFTDLSQGIIKVVQINNDNFN